MIEQTVVYSRPPIFDEARAKFGPMVDRAIFSWGDQIYNPGHVLLTPALMAHEAVHGTRQLATDIKAWWKRYLDDAAFRLDEEILAHCREYGWLCANGNRHQRRHAMTVVSARLSGPLYGAMITNAKARRILKDASREAA